ncbi:MAG: acyl-CoA dehydrogenase family protein [Caulobacteraceae bacterium]|nr:acyl-CoA dehydrogenase family protein [Caulobacteraceae bacterium]
MAEPDLQSIEFRLTEQQAMLQDMLSRFLENEYAFQARQGVVASQAGWSRRHWRQLADLGLLGATFPEDQGGLGGGALETLVIMEQFGRRIVVEPYLSTVVMAGGLLRHGGARALADEHIPAIVAGERTYAFAFAEPQSRYDLADVATTAARRGDGYVLSGKKIAVLGGPAADGLFVTARTGGGQKERAGISVFYVPRDAAGVLGLDYKTIDGQRASELIFEGVEVPAQAVLGEPDEGYVLADRVIDEATAAVCAEAVGAMDVLLEATLEWCRTRITFGEPLASRQVVQHRLVEMKVGCEQARAMAYLAASLENDAPRERNRLISAAKASIGKDSRYVGQNALQLHGALGFTDEFHVGHYFRRLTAIELLFGDAEFHTRRFAELSAD